MNKGIAVTKIIFNEGEIYRILENAKQIISTYRNPNFFNNKGRLQNGRHFDSAARTPDFNDFKHYLNGPKAFRYKPGALHKSTRCTTEANLNA